MPLDNLLERVVISAIAREGIGVDQASERVTTLHRADSVNVDPRLPSLARRTYLVVSMRVHLTASIVRLDIDVELIEDARHEDVSRGLEDLHARERASRNSARAMTGLAAPCDRLRFFVGNRAVEIRRGPDAEIWDRNTRDEHSQSVRFGAGGIDRARKK